MHPDILRALRRDEVRKTGVSLVLVAPRVAFFGVFFIPILTFLALTMSNRENPEGFRETTAALRAWHGADCSGHDQRFVHAPATTHCLGRIGSGGGSP